ncbi:MAG TPA: hypothetical protein VEV81_08180, partial [Pyrinomonadaceae bacterium]|nr:hypothetical protein [Pyrinomonadaceae bacterium]
MAHKTLLLFAVCLLLVALASAAADAQDQKGKPAPLNPQPDPALQALVDEAARTALAKFKDKNLQESNLAITLINLGDPQHPTRASFRGTEGIYPASVVELFYLVMAHHLLEEGKIKETDELRRAIK